MPVFYKKKMFLLSTWYATEKRTPLDNYLYPNLFKIWIKTEYWKVKDPDKSEELKALCMGGDSGRNWAQDYNNNPIDFSRKIGKLSFLEATPFFVDLDNFLANSSECVYVIQIGCSSGKEIAYFSNGHPRHRFIGTDIYESVVQFAKDNHRAKNLTFALVYAHRINEIVPKKYSKAVLLSSGSLNCVHPGHVDLVFKILSSYKNLYFFILEGAGESRGNPLEIKGSTPRSNFGWTHNYCYYAEKYGFETVKRKIIRPYNKNDPLHPETVRYYYVCKSANTKINGSSDAAKL